METRVPESQLVGGCPREGASVLNFMGVRDKLSFRYATEHQDLSNYNIYPDKYDMTLWYVFYKCIYV